MKIIYLKVELPVSLFMLCYYTILMLFVLFVIVVFLYIIVFASLYLFHDERRDEFLMINKNKFLQHLYIFFFFNKNKKSID